MKYIVPITIASFLFTSVASAASIGLEGRIETDGSLGGARVETTHVVNATTAVPVKGVRMEDGVNTAGGVKMEDGSEVKFDAEGGVSSRGTTSEARGVENAQLRANEHALDVLEDVELHIDLRNEERDATRADVDSAQQVRSAQDLKSLVHHRADADARLRSVDIKEGKIDVEYEENAKFFGFIKTTIPAHATVDTDGNVKVSYPWYRFFVVKTHSSDELSTALRAEVSAAHEVRSKNTNSTFSDNVNAKLSVAELFELTANVFAKTAVETNEN